MTKTTKTVLIVLAGVLGLACLCSGGGLLLGLGSSARGGGGQTAADDSSGPPPNIALTGDRQQWGGYSFIPPPGMTAAVGPDGMQLQHPDGQGACSIVLLPQRPAEGALEAQVLAIAQQTFAADTAGLVDEYGDAALLDFQLRGVTSRGWEYVELPNFYLRLRSGEQANLRVRALLLKVGSTVAPIIGMESGGDNCLGELGDHGHRWLRLFYSLDFPDAPRGPDNALAGALVGRWEAVSSSSALLEEYLADGTYRTTGGYRTTREVTPTLDKETTTTWTGGGRWEVHGDRLTTTPEGRATTTNWFRVVRGARSSGGDKLQLRTFNVGIDGVPYEGLVRRE